MANSRKSKSNLAERIADALTSVVPVESSIVLGLSGGMDSVALLDLMSVLAPKFSWRISALHVHHGLSPNADSWADFCRTLCAQYAIPLHVEEVDIAPLRAMGVEAAARQLRYAALESQPVDFVALAHHRDDQVETLMLQLLRGAGVRGASAMPVLRQRQHKPGLLRPLLQIDRVELQQYAQHRQLKWIEDESNADDHYSRNFLRHHVHPLLAQKFPAYRTTLTRSAQHFAEAAELLDDLAKVDASGALIGNCLHLNSLLALNLLRAKNLVRYFLNFRGAPTPVASRLEEIVRQLQSLRVDAQIKIEWAGWELRHYRGLIYTFPRLGPVLKIDMAWRGEAAVALPTSAGSLCFERVTGLGLSLQKLQQRGVTISTRRGGETIQTTEAGPHHALKNIFQERGVPPWWRSRMPLLYCAGELVAVPGLAAAVSFQAQQGEQGVVVSWKQLHYDA